MQQLQEVKIWGTAEARSKGMMLFENCSTMFKTAQRILVPSDSPGQPFERVQHWTSAILGLSVESIWPRIRNEYSAHAQKIGSDHNLVPKASVNPCPAERENWGLILGAQFTKRFASSGDENEHDVDSSLQTQSSIAVIAVESAIKGEGPIQSRMDPFTSFLCQTTEQLSGQRELERSNCIVGITQWNTTNQNVTSEQVENRPQTKLPYTVLNYHFGI